MTLDKELNQPRLPLNKDIPDTPLHSLVPSKPPNKSLQQPVEDVQAEHEEEKSGYTSINEMCSSIETAASRAAEGVDKSYTCLNELSNRLGHVNKQSE